MKIKVMNVKSLSEYITAIEDVNRKFSCNINEIWYRGLSNESYSLVPGVVWRNIDEDMHASMVVEFLTKGIIYDNNLPSFSGYDVYALMQHFGLPTRLLDWTFSPLIALYFALEKDEKNNDRIVWAINPAKLNKLVVDFEWFLFPHDDFTCKQFNLDQYLPDTFGCDNGTLLPGPIAIQVQPKNRRIKSQSGCFTIHGTSKDTIDKVFSDNKCNEIIKITINGSKTREKMLSSLRLLGITEDTIYQDLPSLSKRIMREYGFGS